MSTPQDPHNHITVNVNNVSGSAGGGRGHRGPPSKNEMIGAVLCTFILVGAVYAPILMIVLGAIGIFVYAAVKLEHKRTNTSIVGQTPTPPVPPTPAALPFVVAGRCSFCGAHEAAHVDAQGVVIPVATFHAP